MGKSCSSCCDQDGERTYIYQFEEDYIDPYTGERIPMVIYFHFEQLFLLFIFV
jgi:hypothetical protein